MKHKYEFDLAFSFLAQDEATAFTLYNELKDRLNAFIYSEEQKRLAGTDGEATFNEVFSKLARVVVILYRDEWGKTAWTRIEETAIRNRAHDEGYDYVLLIPMEEGINPPKWFPKNRIWIGLKRFGIKSAAGVIEARVIEQDGNVKVLTAQDKINLLLENNAKEKTRAGFLSMHGWSASQEEYTKFLSALKTALEELKASQPEWKAIIDEKSGSNGNELRVICSNREITIQANLSEDQLIQLHITIWKGVWAYRPGHFQMNIPERLQDWVFKFTLDAYDRRGWLRSGKNDFKLTNEVVDDLLIKFVEYTTTYSSNEKRYLA